MRGSVTFVVAASILSSCTDAIRLQKRIDGPPRVVGLPIQRKSVPDPVVRDRLRRRSGTVQETLDNEETLYFANVSLGTPAQNFRLQLDTGSSDLWVNTPSSSICQEQSRPCSLSGTYKANSSSTYSYVNSLFNITYADGTGATGDYATDKVVIGGTTLDSQQFGIGYTSTSDQGLLGVGYDSNEADAYLGGTSAYKNLPAQMAANGVIQSNAYSLWLNDLEASTGSVLFGGVDTDKYHGSLETLPIQQINGVYAEFLVTLTEVTLGSNVIASDQALAVLLDSGTSLTYLPDAMAEAIYGQVNAHYDSGEGAAYVACSLADNTTALNFKFFSPTISVAMSELVLPVSSSGGQIPTLDGVNLCLFGVAPSGDSTAVLGDTFLRSAYVVYNLDENEISIAQTNFNATSTNVVEIGTGSSGVPSASLVSNAPAATAGIEGGGVGVASTVFIGLGGTSTSKAGAEKTAPPLHLGAMAAVGAGLVYAAM